MKEYSLTRKQYKTIKKFDHNQMSAFLRNLIDDSYASGKKDAEGLSEEATKAAILTVKGVGEKRADSIVAALTEAHRMKGS